jgi:hypothetical protein
VLWRRIRNSRFESGIVKILLPVSALDVIESLESRAVDPDSLTLWIRNTDPDPWARKN